MGAVAMTHQIVLLDPSGPVRADAEGRIIRDPATERTVMGRASSMAGQREAPIGGRNWGPRAEACDAVVLVPLGTEVTKGTRVRVVGSIDADGTYEVDAVKQTRLHLRLQVTSRAP